MKYDLMFMQDQEGDWYIIPTSLKILAEDVLWGCHDDDKDMDFIYSFKVNLEDIRIPSFAYMIELTDDEKLKHSNDTPAIRMHSTGEQTSEGSES